VTALAYAPMILSTDFIDACLKADELLNSHEFQLVDKQNEKKQGASLKVVQERARHNQHQLLRGCSIYCMESIRGGFETFQSIVEANGGRCLQWRNRKGAFGASSRGDGEFHNGTDANDVVYLLSDNRQDSKAMWSRFKQMAEQSRKVPRIVLPDWLLDTAMCQKLLPTKQYEL